MSDIRTTLLNGEVRDKTALVKTSIGSSTDGYGGVMVSGGSTTLHEFFLVTDDGREVACSVSGLKVRDGHLVTKASVGWGAGDEAIYWKNHTTGDVVRPKALHKNTLLAREKPLLLAAYWLAPIAAAWFLFPRPSFIPAAIALLAMVFVVRVVVQRTRSTALSGRIQAAIDDAVVASDAWAAAKRREATVRPSVDPVTLP